MPLAGAHNGAGPKYIGGGVDLIGDTLSVEAIAAYSGRKLYKDFSGAPLRIAEDTFTVAETDIDFNADNTWWDNDAINTYVGSDDPVIAKWYTQIGSEDLAQPTDTLKPLMATSPHDGSERAIYYDGLTGSSNAKCIEALSLTGGSAEKTILAVYVNESTAWNFAISDAVNTFGGGHVVFYDAGATTSQGSWWYAGTVGTSTKVTVGGNPGYAADTLQYAFFEGNDIGPTMDIDLREGGAYYTSSAAATSHVPLIGLVVGREPEGSFRGTKAKILELWVFDGILSTADKDLLKADLNTFYSV